MEADSSAAKAMLTACKVQFKEKLEVKKKPKNVSAILFPVEHSSSKSTVLLKVVERTKEMESKDNIVYNTKA